MQERHQTMEAFSIKKMIENQPVNVNLLLGDFIEMKRSIVIIEA
jgi:hypothetical protein